MIVDPIFADSSVLPNSAEIAAINIINPEMTLINRPNQLIMIKRAKVFKSY